MNSNQRKKLRAKLAAESARDDSRVIPFLAKLSPIGKSVARRGRASRCNNRAAQYVGSGPWTSFPFHHGRTLIRKELADGATKRPL